jgi:hypothetical protein
VRRLRVPQAAQVTGVVAQPAGFEIMGRTMSDPASTPATAAAC